MKNLPIIALTLGLLLISNSSSHAEEKTLYKNIDKNGRVIFTDKPLSGAKKIVVDTSKNVLSAPKYLRKGHDGEEAPDSEDKKPNEKSATYRIFAIDKPSADESIAAKNGNLYVIVALSPQLDRKHSIHLLLDGAQVGQDQKVPYFSLTNINRGTHQLIAQIVNDKTDKLLQSTEPLEFHLSK